MSSKAHIIKLPERYVVIIGNGKKEWLYARSAYHAVEIANAIGAGEIVMGDVSCLNFTPPRASSSGSSRSSSTEPTENNEDGGSDH